MKNTIKIATLIITCFALSAGCGNKSPQEYMSVAEQIHNIECTHLKMYNVNLPDTISVYDFKSAAFQYILKNTDRRVLAEYEDLSNKLAHVTYFMDDGQKAACESDIEKIYRKRCP